MSNTTNRRGKDNSNNSDSDNKPAIGVNMRVTAHYTQGNRKYMEDKMSVAYQQSKDLMDFDFVYVGIFDGHGGPEAAIFAKERLLESIVSHKQFWTSDNDYDVLKAITHGYLQTHLNMWTNIERWPLHVNGLPSTAGTTASIAFVRRGKIYIGHVGDSAIVLGYQEEGQQKWSAKSLTLDHKPGVEPEISRIHSSGGKVVPKVGIPRVVWRRPVLGAEDNRYDEIPFLAIARSLGDVWSYNRESDEFIVSPVPDVGVIEIDPNKFKCLIFGTDGLWNMITPDEAVNMVYEAEKHNEKEAGCSTDNQNRTFWRNPSQKLVDSALERWSDSHMRADNISVVTLMLDPPGPPRKTPVKASNKNVSYLSETLSKDTPEPKPSQPKYCVSEPISVASSSASAPTPPLGVPRYGIVNYGNPTESYYVSKILNQTEIINSLAHIPAEMFETNVAITRKEEVVADNNNETTTTKKTVTQKNSVTITKTTSSVEGDLAIPCSSTETISMVKEECIQINEVSSSSLDVKVKNAKGKALPSKVEADNQAIRNLRSREPVAPARPQTRHRGKGKVAEPQSPKVESKLPVPVVSKVSSSDQRDKVVIMPRPKPFQSTDATTPDESPKISNLKIQKRVPIDVKSKTIVVDNKQKIVPVNTVRMTRSKDTQAVEPISKKDLGVGNFCPPKRTFLRSRQQDASLENNEDSLKENIVSSGKSTPSKSAKRRNNVSEPGDIEPKEKRRTRLDDKKDPKASRDQPSPVSSTEDTSYILGLRLDVPLDKKKSQDTNVAVDSTLNEIRALRSNNCIQANDISDGCRPILRSKNNTTCIMNPKPQKRRVQFPHSLRHNLRRRAATTK